MFIPVAGTARHPVVTSRSIDTRGALTSRPQPLPPCQTALSVVISQGTAFCWRRDCRRSKTRPDPPVILVACWGCWKKGAAGIGTNFGRAFPKIRGTLPIASHELSQPRTIPHLIQEPKTAPSGAAFVSPKKVLPRATSLDLTHLLQNISYQTRYGTQYPLDNCKHISRFP